MAKGFWDAIMEILAGLGGSAGPKPPVTAPAPPAGRLGLVAHPLVDRTRELRLISALRPSRVRLSCTQYGFLKDSTRYELAAYAAAGIPALYLCGSNTLGSMSPEEWERYCDAFTRALPSGAPAPWIQLANEPNTITFFGKQPNAELAWHRCMTAATIILRRFPRAYLVGPGLTNETKTGTGKIAAAEFIATWRRLGIARLSAFACHFYDGDRHLDNLLDNIRDWDREKPVLLTEVGSPSDPVGFYRRILSGDVNFSLPIDRLFWYVWNDHDPFRIWDGKKTSTLYGVMKGGK